MWSEMGADRDSPLFFRKIVEIEGFSLRASILDECQIYSLASNSLPRYRMKPRWPPVCRPYRSLPPPLASSLHIPFTENGILSDINIRILHQISALVIFKQGKVKEAFEESTTHKLSVRISHKVRLSVILCLLKA